MNSAALRSFLYLSLALYPGLAWPAPNPNSKENEVLQVHQENGRIFLNLCKGKNECKPVGAPEGYTKSQVQSWIAMRAPEFKDQAPLMLSVSAGAILITAIPLAPVGITIGIGAAVSALFGWAWLTHPQVRAGMPNSVIHHWRANGSLRKEMERLVAEIDSGIPGNIRNGAVISQNIAPRKQEEHGPASLGSTWNSIPAP